MLSNCMFIYHLNKSIKNIKAVGPSPSKINQNDHGNFAGGLYSRLHLLNILYVAHCTRHLTATRVFLCPDDMQSANQWPNKAAFLGLSSCHDPQLLANFSHIVSTRLQMQGKLISWLP